MCDIEDKDKNIDTDYFISRKSFLKAIELVMHHHELIKYNTYPDGSWYDIDASEALDFVLNNYNEAFQD